MTLLSVIGSRSLLWLLYDVGPIKCIWVYDCRILCRFHSHFPRRKLRAWLVHSWLVVAFDRFPLTLDDELTLLSLEENFILLPRQIVMAQDLVRS
jgi:hypothetical protein